ncbi:MAG: histidine kinase [Marinilabiliaceae bacterium]|nr:histidine kinase [Marinilabiliaceae bacterium]
MKKHIFVSILLFTSSLSIISQTSQTSPGKYYLFKNYTTQNGLLNNDIYAMKQDKYGYIWIGSILGVTRFDGKTFYHKAIDEIYDNPTLVTHFATTQDGNIIAASYMQGIFVQQDDGQFKQFLEGDAVAVGKNIFKVVKTFSDNSILACTGRSLFLIKDGVMSQIYDYGNTMSIFNSLGIDKENRIWFGGRFGVGFMQISDTGYEPFFFPELKDKLVDTILLDDDGTLHIATVQGYFRIKWNQPARLDTDYIIEQPFQQLKDIYISQMMLDKDKNLWIPTDSYGVFRTKGDSITLHLTQENGLISSSVTRMMQDKEGNYWFGTINGISMIKDFDNFAIANNGILFKDASNITADEFHRLWIYSRSAIYLYHNDKLIPVSLSGSPIEVVGIRSLEIINNDLLISNDLGLYKMPISKSLPDMRKLEKVADYQTHRVVGLLHALTADSEGVWICSVNKLCNYNNGQFQPITFNHPDSVSLSPRRIIRDKYGYYWCGDYANGLYRGVISRNEKNKILFDVKTVYKSLIADTTFVTATIRDMSFDKEGNLWFSSLYTGVYKLAINCNGVVSYKLYSTADGLLSNNVYGIDFDDNGNVWFLTQRGISILRTDSSGVESIDKFDVNPRMEGISSSPLQIGDRLYLLTEEGIFVTQAQYYQEKEEFAPKVIITNLLINGVVNSEISANTNNLTLAFGQNNITIEYAAIIFNNADNVRYQYKLENADHDWSVLSERVYVEFATLRPGRYTFKVRAAMVGAETFIGEETSFSFRIRPAYYQTIWFYSLIAIAIVSLLYALHKFRLRQILKMERMRTRIASDLHDDIGSTLSSINLISEIASQHAQESALAKALSKIGTDSKVVLSSMDDIIWSVNPKNDSLSSLLVRLREYAIPLCESKNIALNMQAEDSIHSIKLEMDQRRNIFLIVKESINNAVKHSGCKNLTIDFSKTHDLEILIQDDGCGFDPTSPSSRNGIVNIKRRAEQIGSELIINSEKEKGTIIRLRIKII